MDRITRPLLIVLAVIEIIFAIGYSFQIPFALSLWPFPSMSPLSYLLLGSAFATAASITLWPVVMREPAAIAGAGVVYVGLPLPLAIYSFISASRSGSQGQMIFAVIMLIGAIIGAGLLISGWRSPARDVRPQPLLVKISFVMFIIPLFLAGVQMILKRPNILPWNVTPELSVIFGWVFTTAMIYFTYGLLRGGWANAAPHLMAFLVYDLVLLAPFLMRVPALAPEHRISMVIYLAALIYSFFLAIYTLFIDPKTRVIGATAGL